MDIQEFVDWLSDNVDLSDRIDATIAAELFEQFDREMREDPETF